MQPNVGHNHLASPSAWVLRWLPLVAAGGRVLDLACGGGRHTVALAERGFQVEAVDRDVQVVSGSAHGDNVRILQADLESGPWPYGAAQFNAVVVTNYLHRPLFPSLIASLKPGAVVIYETFAVGNEKFGRPSSPAFLLQPGELLDVFRPIARVLGYEDLYVEQPKPAMVQRICARLLA
jgi:SAM-dependent methyltransferase